MQSTLNENRKKYFRLKLPYIYGLFMDWNQKLPKMPFSTSYWLPKMALGTVFEDIWPKFAMFGIGFNPLTRQFFQTMREFFQTCENFFQTGEKFFTGENFFRLAGITFRLVIRIRLVRRGQKLAQWSKLTLGTSL